MIRPVTISKTCQYCRKAKTEHWVRTATGKRWKCLDCQNKRQGPSW